MTRVGGSLYTFSGKRFWPLDPMPDELVIEDIAHALSLQCRYGGHCVRFYSVAEHSVHLARHVSPPNRLWALLHDASEAYLADVPRPVKSHLTGYRDAEAGVMAAVVARYGLACTMPDEVHQADNRIIGDEMRQNMHEVDPAYGQPLGITLRFWTPEQAECEFLGEFARLTA
ncbi:MAG: hypothetical protein EOR26_05075 [Mesorhizobium sp.]|uniref:hypothetical protein n=1 Tax=unclassified Mesorhizobium TaxID=325217 RepID=UPI000FCC327F|nr:MULTISPECIES: hypothetical protein [unclassified Mesorhizobium]RUV69652.1 hypothetical protein EOA78_22690 [Mesorhizobium sp. M5C.F.Cr.IN.023.01.1.1]RWI51072.1 MAG: hypothetical protein EOR15_06655 [Mesorhizobium sp.]RWI62060.1 MAG: hypothetical protein EOR16_03855 [Mesorhizobium sp.]RWJ13910.1 MAG: hypothetical protein EOR24_01110 [Mesorhizobium sp.]RWJ16864.1 MAG: hypothetical protein EOR25_13330 [Mesorhizobium sp.]